MIRTLIIIQEIKINTTRKKNNKQKLKTNKKNKKKNNNIKKKSDKTHPTRMSEGPQHLKTNIETYKYVSILLNNNYEIFNTGNIDIDNYRFNIVII